MSTAKQRAEAEAEVAFPQKRDGVNWINRYERRAFIKGHITGEQTAKRIKRKEST